MTDQPRSRRNLEFADVKLASYQSAAIWATADHFAMFGGVGVGKSFTGAHFVIHMMQSYPALTGLIGANSYDQLSQATLAELMVWLDHYGLEYVVDRRPPREWGRVKKLKKYNNTISVRIRNRVALAFTRVMSKPNPLRGMQISWYYLDEVRDTPENTHDVVMARLREHPDVHRGLVTTTTNGEDWSYRRFVRNADGQLFGAMHVKTTLAVSLGILTQQYYESMRRAYSPLMAAQELEAEHVNVLGGMAYHSWTPANQSVLAPWGDAVPDRKRPLLLGCDFNFAPAPCIWMVGQLGPGKWSESLHWFGEVEQTAVSTESMAKLTISRYPDYSWEIYGDASGARGTTSNAGDHDYIRISRTFTEAGIPHTIDFDQANPLVKDRVENVCSKLRNAAGETTMTYNPETCPRLDEDFRQVGWTKHGKLDDGGIVTRTHASDGAGYATWKVLPFGQPLGLPQTIRSVASQTKY